MRLGITGTVQIIFWTLNILNIDPVASWSLWGVWAPFLIWCGVTALLLIASAFSD